jgi:hypothetical protein
MQPSLYSFVHVESERAFFPYRKHVNALLWLLRCRIDSESECEAQASAFTSYTTHNLQSATHFQVYTPTTSPPFCTRTSLRQSATISAGDRKCEFPSSLKQCDSGRTNLKCSKPRLAFPRQQDLRQVVQYNITTRIIPSTQSKCVRSARRIQACKFALV